MRLDWTGIVGVRVARAGKGIAGAVLPHRAIGGGSAVRRGRNVDGAGAGRPNIAGG